MADDILQEVFLRVHARLETFKKGTHLQAWLYQITRHAIADYYRAHRPDNELPISGFARQGMAKMGHIPPQGKVRQLKELGTHFYLCGPSMQVFKVKKDELIFDDVTIAEYLTFMEIMKNADIHIYL